MPHEHTEFFPSLQINGKPCSACGEDRPLSEYAMSKRGRLKARCKRCDKEYLTKWHRENKQKVREYREATKEARNSRRRELYQSDPEFRQTIIDKVAEYRRKHPEQKRAAALRSNYGITPERFAAILASQGGGCAICGRTESDEKRSTTLHVDHDHRSGEVRGVLCSKCNKAIGLFGDDPVMLRNAAEYIDGSRWESAT